MATSFKWNVDLGMAGIRSPIRLLSLYKLFMNLACPVNKINDFKSQKTTAYVVDVEPERRKSVSDLGVGQTGAKESPTRGLFLKRFWTFVSVLCHEALHQCEDSTARWWAVACWRKCGTLQLVLGAQQTTAESVCCLNEAWVVVHI